MVRLILLIASGLLAGIINGLLGTGGGIILIFALTFLNVEPKNAFAETIAVILPMSVVSAVGYIQNGNVPIDQLWIYILPSIAGGIAGAVLLDKLKVVWVKKIFALIVIYAGITML